MSKVVSTSYPDVVRRLMKMHYQSKTGHLGGNLSALRMLLVLYRDILQPKDQFVLSKGHAAGALYVTLWSKGLLSDLDLESFHKDNTLLSGHPPAEGIPSVLFATGSLGHGLGLASGLALSKKLQRDTGVVYCLTSDGEWNEGSTWESLIFGCRHKLDNLCVLVDLNGLQGFGTTNDVSGIRSLRDKIESFGAHTVEIDGHDEAEIAEALRLPAGDAPRFIVARTVKGKGVSFMENKMEWHYLPMTDEQYAQAMAEVESS